MLALISGPFFFRGIVSHPDGRRIFPSGSGRRGESIVIRKRTRSDRIPELRQNFRPEFCGASSSCSSCGGGAVAFWRR